MKGIELLETSLSAVYDIEWSAEVMARLFGPPDHPTLASVGEAYDTIRAESTYVLPEELVPLLTFDERSLGCVAIGPLDSLAVSTGDVVRWHLDDVALDVQAELIDLDPLLYVKSLEDELGARKIGIKRVMDEIGPAYEESHLKTSRRPRDYVVRPVRIACQNVIVALAAFSQESSFDGLSVVAWQTCEVAHVAAHESNRALAALTLCDAFQNGGTMEIRFDHESSVTVNGERKLYSGHPEGQVPASLRRYGRTVGVELGKEDPQAITPVEARELFWAITPMPDGLRRRAEEAVERLGVLPERLCFTLLAQVWREIELDFLLGTSHRAPSVLNGGALWTHRLARQAESETCRSAKMSGMLYRRLNGTDSASADGEVRVVEDRSQGVEWQVEDDAGAIRYTNLPEGYLPWSHGHVSASTLLVFPRAAVSNNLRRTLQAAVGVEPTAILIPRDAEQPVVPDGVVVMRCPDRLADIDQMIESTLLTSRISRG